MQKIISIDQSFSNLAMVYWEDSIIKDRVVFHSGSRTKDNLKKSYGCYFDSITDQIIYLADLATNWISSKAPEAIVMEGLSMGSNGNMVRPLAGLFYCILVDLKRNHNLPLSIYEVAPQTVKATARAFLNPHDRVRKDKSGVSCKTRTGRDKVNPMPKTWMVKALEETKYKWVIEGYTTSSTTVETGKHDLPDAVFLGLSHINGKSREIS